MKQILLSADGPVYLCLVPDIVEKNLRLYIEEFETEIGENCSIALSSIISNKNVKIGNNVVIGDNVVICENTTIKDNVIIRANSVIGGEGFEFKRFLRDSIEARQLGVFSF